MSFEEYKDKKSDKKVLDELSLKVMNEMIRLTNVDI